MKPPTDLDDARKRRESKNWRRGLIEDSRGNAVRGVANTMHVLARHPLWHGVLVYDEFHMAIRKAAPPPTREQDGAGELGAWTEADTTRTSAWFASEVGFEPTPGHVEQAVAATAGKNAVHPVRDYLRGLTWDDTARLDPMLHTYFGARATPYTQSVGPRWMISAVARVMRPGCQADCMLVLEGKQGVGKSTGLAALFGAEWFADTGVHIGEKDSYQSLRAKWVYEFGELAAIKGREVERVKSFVSARVDTYRPSYGRRAIDFPRQNVFAGTTNEGEYLADATGNRRFWPVACGTVDVAAIQRDRDQLWAEACTRFQAGDSWHVDSPELRALCEDEQASREVEDPWANLVGRWLKLELAKGGVRADKGISTDDALEGAIKLRGAEMNRAAQTRIGHVLKGLGWERRRLRVDGERAYLYFPADPTVPSTAPPQEILGEVDVSLEKQPHTQLSLPSSPDVYGHTHMSARSSIGSFLGRASRDGDSGEGET